MVQVQLGPPRQRPRGAMGKCCEKKPEIANDDPENGFFDNCIQGNKEKDTGSKAVLRDGLRHQHSWKMIPGRITANIKNGFRRL